VFFSFIAFELVVEDLQRHPHRPAAVATVALAVDLTTRSLRWLCAATPPKVLELDVVSPSVISFGFALQKEAKTQCSFRIYSSRPEKEKRVLLLFSRPGTTAKFSSGSQADARIRIEVS